MGDLFHGKSELDENYLKMGCIPNSWLVDSMENPIKTWVIWGSTPISGNHRMNPQEWNMWKKSTLIVNIPYRTEVRTFDQQ